MRILNSQLHTDDIILSKVAHIGYFARVDDELKICNISENNIGIKLGNFDKAKRHFILTYLNTKFGQILILRRRSGNAQPKLNVDDVCKIPIPEFSDDFSKIISSLILKSDFMSERADENYHAAEKTLSEALNLENFKPTSENIAIKSFSASFMASGRLDAEFYQPKYDDIAKKLFDFDKNAKKLADIVEYIFTGEYSEEYHDKNSSTSNLKYYIRGTDINNGRIILDEKYCVISKGFSKFVSTGDILTGRVGTIGNFGVVDVNLNGSVCSDNIICFRLPKNYNPNVYALYFNNNFIKDLCKKLSRGSVQQRLNQETLTDLFIPFINEEMQEKIAAQVSESFKLRSESEKFL